MAKRLRVVLTDRKLMEKIQAGDERALEEFMERFTDKARGLCYKLFYGWDDSFQDEAINRAFFRVWHRSSTFKFKSTPGSWFYRILFNEIMQIKRRETKVNKDIDPDGLTKIMDHRADRPISITGRLTAREKLKLIGGRLREDLGERNIMALTGLGYEPTEISAWAGLSIPAVKSRIHRVRERVSRYAA